MELFGYLCSPFCKTKAEALKIDVPVYVGQKTVVEAKYWKKVGKIFATAGGVTAALFGFWFWYAWFGSVPHPGIFRALRRSGLHRRGEILREGPNRLPPWPHPGAL